jgi:hypothetical protein
MALLYGRAGRLTAKNGGFRTGQLPAGFQGTLVGSGYALTGDRSYARRSDDHRGILRWVGVGRTGSGGEYPETELSGRSANLLVGTFLFHSTAELQHREIYNDVDITMFYDVGRDILTRAQAVHASCAALTRSETVSVTKVESMEVCSYSVVSAAAALVFAACPSPHERLLEILAPGTPECVVEATLSRISSVNEALCVLGPLSRPGLAVGPVDNLNDSQKVMSVVTKVLDRLAAGHQRDLTSACFLSFLKTIQLAILRQFTRKKSAKSQELFEMYTARLCAAAAQPIQAALEIGDAENFLDCTRCKTLELGIVGQVVPIWVMSLGCVRWSDCTYSCIDAMTQLWVSLSKFCCETKSLKSWVPETGSIPWPRDLQLSLGHYAATRLLRIGMLDAEASLSPRMKRWASLLKNGRITTSQDDVVAQMRQFAVAVEPICLKKLGLGDIGGTAETLCRCVFAVLLHHSGLISIVETIDAQNTRMEVPAVILAAFECARSITDEMHLKAEEIGMNSSHQQRGLDTMLSKAEFLLGFSACATDIFDDSFPLSRANSGSSRQSARLGRAMSKTSSALSQTSSVRSKLSKSSSRQKSITATKGDEELPLQTVFAIFDDVLSFIQQDVDVGLLRDDITIAEKLLRTRETALLKLMSFASTTSDVDIANKYFGSCIASTIAESSTTIADMKLETVPPFKGCPSEAATSISAIFAQVVRYCLQTLDTAAFGSYALLLCVSWREEDCPLLHSDVWDSLASMSDTLADAQSDGDFSDSDEAFVIRALKWNIAVTVCKRPKHDDATQLALKIIESCCQGLQPCTRNQNSPRAENLIYLALLLPSKEISNSIMDDSQMQINVLQLLFRSLARCGRSLTWNVLAPGIILLLRRLLEVVGPSIAHQSLQCEMLQSYMLDPTTREQRMEIFSKDIQQHFSDGSFRKFGNAQAALASFSDAAVPMKRCALQSRMQELGFALTDTELDDLFYGVQEDKCIKLSSLASPIVENFMEIQSIKASLLDEFRPTECQAVQFLAHVARRGVRKFTQKMGEAVLPEPEPLGCEDGTIPDDAFTASSTDGEEFHTHFARLNGPKYWCAKNHDSSKWMQVDLGQTMTVCGVDTQSARSCNEYVKLYTISYSNDGGAWEEYKEAGAVKTFDGNVKDGDDIVHHDFEPFRARMVRINVVSYNGYSGLRMEWHGCQSRGGLIRTNNCKALAARTLRELSVVSSDWTESISEVVATVDREDPTGASCQMHSTAVDLCAYSESLCNGALVSVGEVSKHVVKRIITVDRTLKKAWTLDISSNSVAYEDTHEMVPFGELTLNEDGLNSILHAFAQSIHSTSLHGLPALSGPAIRERMMSVHQESILRAVTQIAGKANSNPQIVKMFAEYGLFEPFLQQAICADADLAKGNLDAAICYQHEYTNALDERIGALLSCEGDYTVDNLNKFTETNILSKALTRHKTVGNSSLQMLLNETHSQMSRVFFGGVQPAGPVYLCTFGPDTWKYTGKGSLIKGKGAKFAGGGGHVMKHKGVLIENGIGMVPTSGNENGKAIVKYSLLPESLQNSRTAVFRASVAINDGMTGSDIPHLTFRVYSDGVVLWTNEATPITKTGQVQPVFVYFKKASSLYLEVSCKGSNSKAHAVWIDPRVEPASPDFIENCNSLEIAAQTSTCDLVRAAGGARLAGQLLRRHIVDIHADATKLEVLACEQPGSIHSCVTLLSRLACYGSMDTIDAGESSSENSALCQIILYLVNADKTYLGAEPEPEQQISEQISEPEPETDLGIDSGLYPTVSQLAYIGSVPEPEPEPIPAMICVQCEGGGEELVAAEKVSLAIPVDTEDQSSITEGDAVIAVHPEYSSSMHWGATVDAIEWDEQHAYLVYDDGDETEQQLDKIYFSRPMISLMPADTLVFIKEREYHHADQGPFWEYRCARICVHEKSATKSVTPTAMAQTYSDIVLTSLHGLLCLAHQKSTVIGLEMEVALLHLLATGTDEVQCGAALLLASVYGSAPTVPVVGVYLSNMENVLSKVLSQCEIPAEIPPEDAEPVIYIVNYQGRVNKRAAPSTDAEGLGTISQNDRVCSYQRSGDWIRVNADSTAKAEWVLTVSQKGNGLLLVKEVPDVVDKRADDTATLFALHACTLVLNQQIHSKGPEMLLRKLLDSQAVAWLTALVDRPLETPRRFFLSGVDINQTASSTLQLLGIDVPSTLQQQTAQTDPARDGADDHVSSAAEKLVIPYNAISVKANDDLGTCKEIALQGGDKELSEFHNTFSCDRAAGLVKSSKVKLNQQFVELQCAKRQLNQLLVLRAALDLSETATSVSEDSIVDFVKLLECAAISGKPKQVEEMVEQFMVGSEHDTSGPDLLFGQLLDDLYQAAETGSDPAPRIDIAVKVISHVLASKDLSSRCQNTMKRNVGKLIGAICGFTGKTRRRLIDAMTCLCDFEWAKVALRGIDPKLNERLRELFWSELELSRDGKDGKGGFGTQAIHKVSKLMVQWDSIYEKADHSVPLSKRQLEFIKAMEASYGDISGEEEKNLIIWDDRRCENWIEYSKRQGSHVATMKSSAPDIVTVMSKDAIAPGVQYFEVSVSSRSDCMWIGVTNDHTLNATRNLRHEPKSLTYYCGRSSPDLKSGSAQWDRIPWAERTDEPCSEYGAGDVIGILVARTLPLSSEGLPGARICWYKNDEYQGTSGKLPPDQLYLICQLDFEGDQVALRSAAVTSAHVAQLQNLGVSGVVTNAKPSLPETIPLKIYLQDQKSRDVSRSTVMQGVRDVLVQLEREASRLGLHEKAAAKAKESASEDSMLLMGADPGDMEVSFTDTEADISTLKLSDGVLSWWSGGRCFVEKLTSLVWEHDISNPDHPKDVIRAPQSSVLVARLISPPTGPEREALATKVTQLAVEAAVDLAFENRPAVPMSGTLLYTGLDEEGVAIRTTPEYPGVRLGEDAAGGGAVESGTMVDFTARKTFRYQNLHDVMFYQLADGRGWIHDFTAKQPGVRLASIQRVGPVAAGTAQADARQDMITDFRPACSPNVRVLFENNPKLKAILASCGVRARKEKRVQVIRPFSVGSVTPEPEIQSDSEGLYPTVSQLAYMTETSEPGSWGPEPECVLVEDSVERALVSELDRRVQERQRIIANELQRLSMEARGLLEPGPGPEPEPEPGPGPGPGPEPEPGPGPGPGPGLEPEPEPLPEPLPELLAGLRAESGSMMADLGQLRALMMSSEGAEVTALPRSGANIEILQSDLQIIQTEPLPAREPELESELSPGSRFRTKRETLQRLKIPPGRPGAAGLSPRLEPEPESDWLINCRAALDIGQLIEVIDLCLHDTFRLRLRMNWTFELALAKIRLLEDAARSLQDGRPLPLLLRVTNAMRRSPRQQQPSEAGSKSPKRKLPEKLSTLVTQTCEDGHLLQANPLPINTCDVCDAIGTAYRCSEGCDWDMCQLCFDKCGGMLENAVTNAADAADAGPAGLDKIPDLAVKKSLIHNPAWCQRVFDHYGAAPHLSRMASEPEPESEQEPEPETRLPPPDVSGFDVIAVSDHWSMEDYVVLVSLMNASPTAEQACQIEKYISLVSAEFSME